ncbi:hypothetical protein ACFW6U_26220 [Pseudomonas guariconensis]|uniref:hypothetical protein n=1 Tax=Pseudomonas guariconensis TaxID=1288410 RepID=UPI00366EEAB0
MDILYDTQHDRRQPSAFAAALISTSRPALMPSSPRFDAYGVVGDFLVDAVVDAAGIDRGDGAFVDGRRRSGVGFRNKCDFSEINATRLILLASGALGK